MRKKFRFLTVLAVCVMVLSCFSVTTFAYADDTEQNLLVTEATQPEQQPETTPTPDKPKDMIGIPWMLAFALRDTGWYLRNDIIWKMCIRDRIGIFSGWGSARNS